MRDHYMMIKMFIGMFLIQYFISSYIMTNKIENITSSTSKIYMCIIMGLFMGFLDILLSPKFEMNLFVFFSVLIILFIYLYRIQFGIDDKNYIQEMVEHHSMALLTSKNILEKTKNPAIINFATNIIVTQEKEIDDMRYLLKSI
jgi:hypothetical protein